MNYCLECLDVEEYLNELQSKEDSKLSPATIKVAPVTLNTPTIAVNPGSFFQLTSHGKGES